jgi:ATP-binding cassette subfamily B protein
MKEKLSSSFSTFKLCIWSFKFLYGIFPLETIFFLIGKLLEGIDAIAYSYILGRIIDLAIKLSQDSLTTIHDLIPILLIFLLYLILQRIVYLIEGSCSSKIEHYSSTYIRKKNYYKMKELGLQEFENPGILDQTDLIQDWSYRVPELYMNFCDFLSSVFSCIFSGFILYSYIPLLLPFLAIWEIIGLLPSNKLRREDWQYQLSNIEERRRNWCNSSFLQDKDKLKEITITGAFRYLDKKYYDFYINFMTTLFSFRRKIRLWNFLSSLIGKVLQVVGYGLILSRTIKGSISIGSTAFAIYAVGNFSQSARGISGKLQTIDNLIVKLRDVYDFYNLETSFKDGYIKMPRLENGPTIKLENISFKYPQSDKYLFNNFSFSINSNEKIAIVGENGAGKTSLVKLIMRLYDVPDGVLYINGKDIKDYKIDDWYKNIGILFQDYNFYDHLTAEENIYLGKSKKKLDKEKIIKAAKEADADDFIQKYPKKYQTILSEKYKGGIKPSEGQKQKIAIARLFYRNSPLVIFDEPTSSIDALSEARIFNRIYKFFKNKTVIIISHRFSTVRNADRIIVLDKGKILEEGSHEELMRLEGKYAESFRKQAKGYN